MASTAELESRYLAGQRASSTLAATGGAPTGNQSNGVVYATGSDTPRTLADWMALVNGESVINLAAYLDARRVAGTTDDTAAFNALTAEIRARGPDANGLLEISVVIPPGNYSVSSWDLTELLGRSVNVVAYGAVLTARTAGLNVIDCAGSRWLKFYGIKTYSPASVLALAGIQLGPKGTETCGNNALINCDFLGYYTRAAYANLASETTYAIGCTFQNVHTSGYAAIGDGFSQFLPESEYATITRQANDALSLTNNKHYSCQFRQEGGGSHSIYVCNTQNWAWDSSCYFLAFTGAPFHLYGTSTRRNQFMSVAGLFETALNFSPYTGIDYCFELDGDGTGTAIDGFRLDTFFPQCAIAMYRNSGASTYRISNADIRIVGLQESAAVWFSGMSADTLDGDIWTRDGTKLNLDDIARFTGTIRVSDVSGMGMPIDGSYTIIDSTNETTTYRQRPFSVMLAASAVAGSALTGSTSETVLATIPIPAGAMGLNGILRVTAFFSLASSSNGKSVRCRLGGLAGTAFSSPSGLTTNAYASVVWEIANRASASSQYSTGQCNRTTDFLLQLLTPSTGTVNTAVAQDLVLTGQLADAADSITLQRYSIELLNVG